MRNFRCQRAAEIQIFCLKFQSLREIAPKDPDFRKTTWKGLWWHISIYSWWYCFYLSIYYFITIDDSCIACNWYNKIYLSKTGPTPWQRTFKVIFDENWGKRKEVSKRSNTQNWVKGSHKSHKSYSGRQRRLNDQDFVFPHWRIIMQVFPLADRSARWGAR